jgi:hypothetical protein
MSPSRPAELILPLKRDLSGSTSSRVRTTDAEPTGDRLPTIHGHRVDHVPVPLHVVSDLFEINYAIVDFRRGGTPPGAAAGGDRADAVTDLLCVCLQRAHNVPFPHPKYMLRSVSAAFEH